jgi:hypothetical protein
MAIKTLATLQTTPESPFIVAGGFGYEKKRNGVASDYIKSLGHVALPPLHDPAVARAPKTFTVQTDDGATRTVRRQLTYFLAPKPEVTLVSSQYQERRADDLIAHLEEHTQAPVNGIFQSADAQNGLIAAHKRPDLFSNIVLAFPAGLVKKRSSTEYTRQMLKSAVRHRGPKHRPDRADDFEATTRLKSVREKRKERRFSKSGGLAVASSVAVSYQNRLLTELRQDAGAPGVSLVLGMRDSMMKPERIIESLNDSNDVDCIFITNTKHGWNGSKQLMDQILDLFPAMEEIKAKRRTGQEVAPLAHRISFAEDVSAVDKLRILTLVNQLDKKSARTK